MKFGMKELVRKNIGQFVLVFMMIFIIALCSVGYPYSLKYVVDDMLPQGNFNNLKSILAIMLIMIFVQILFSFLANRKLSKIIQEYILETKEIILNNIIGKINFDENQKSTIQIIFSSDFEKIGDNLILVIGELVQSSLVFFLYLTAIVTLNIKLAMLIILMVPIVLMINLFFGRIVGKYYRIIQSNLDQVNKLVQEILVGEFLIRAFKCISVVKENALNKNYELKNNNVRYTSMQVFTSSLTAILSTLLPFLVLLVGSKMVIENQISLGTLLTSFTFAGTIFMPITSIFGVIPIYQELLVSFERVSNYLNIDDLSISNNNIQINGDLEEYINLENVIFGYDFPKNKIPVNAKINGGINFIIGENGIGKSTLAKSIAKLIPIFQGKLIYKENFDILYIDNSKFIFSKTVRENLTIGLRDFDKNLLDELINILNIHEFINNKYDELSLGQIQKIKICRALLDCKGKMVIFDEVFSNLDIFSKKMLYNYIETIKNSSIVVIDHNVDYHNLQDANIIKL